MRPSAHGGAARGPPRVQGVSVDDAEEKLQRKSSLDEPFAALAFKVASDPYLGSLTFCRVYSGKMDTGTYVYNSSKGKKERIARMLEMHANSREDRKIARAGDIVAIGGLKDTVTGETLCDEKHPIILEKMDFPEPVIKARLRPRCRA
jgi:elongation factor G